MPLLTIPGIILLVSIVLFLAYCTFLIIRAKADQKLPEDQYDKKYEDRDALGILYQTGHQNLLTFKENQWSLTNYSLIGIAAIVAAFLIIYKSNALCIWFKYIAVFLVVLISGFGAVLVTYLQLGIVVHRVALNQMKQVLFKEGMPGYIPTNEENDWG
ncbi:MAG TPA: hypothetical protein ENI06_00445 [Spirochaetales bacterium]|nr:hypothetical protein [Spirochaetales bacterium]